MEKSTDEVQKAGSNVVEALSLPTERQFDWTQLAIDTDWHYYLDNGAHRFLDDLTDVTKSDQRSLSSEFGCHRSTDKEDLEPTTYSEKMTLFKTW